MLRLPHAVASVGLAVVLAGCVPAADGPIPAGYEPLVDSARESVLSNYEGLPRPGLSFTGIRCYADGGLVLFFRQVGGRSHGEPAFAMGGIATDPASAGWSGGYGTAEDIEEEIQFNHRGVPQVACPPRQGGG